MGNRTSDFVALATIVGGAGLGFGLTSLFAGAAPEVQVNDTSVEIRVVPGRVLMGPSSTIHLGRPGAYASSKGFRFTMDRRRAEMRSEMRSDREDVERLTAEAEKLLREALEEGDFSTVLSEALEGLDAIEIIGDLDLRVDGTTIEILRGNGLERIEVRAGSDEDEDDRRRRRRRPREEAEIRASGASGNR